MRHTVLLNLALLTLAVVASTPAAHAQSVGCDKACLENLADRDYVLVSGYNTPGRSGVFSLRWNAD